jgi:hypothetical protein
MPDEPFRFAISPIVTERNARRLVDIMAQSFAGGATSEELRIRFEEVTGLKRQMFYDTLRFTRYRNWLIGGGKGKLYQLNPDGCWKPTQTSAGQILEKDQLEYLANSRAQQIDELQGEVKRLLNWSNSADANGDANSANIALSSLIRIVGDSAASTRQRIRAAAAVLNYKAQADVSEFVRKYLQSLCENTDIAVDYRIEAGELLRRHEAPRVTPESIRPDYRDDAPTEPIEPLASVVARQRERADRMEREMALQLEREMGLRSDETTLEQPLGNTPSLEVE